MAELNGYLEVDTEEHARVLAAKPGGTLAELLDRRGGLCIRSTLKLGVAVARQLHLVHKVGLVHGHIEPSRLIVCEDEGGFEVTVVDLGMSGRRALRAHDGQDGRKIAYASPEQLVNGVESVSGDIYSLGAVLYQCLSGAPPFNFNSNYLTMRAHAKFEPPAIESLAVDSADPPSFLVELIRQMLAKSPRQRPSSMEEVCRRLDDMHEASAGETLRGWMAVTDSELGRAAATTESEPSTLAALRSQAMFDDSGVIARVPKFCGLDDSTSVRQTRRLDICTRTLGFAMRREPSVQVGPAEHHTIWAAQRSACAIDVAGDAALIGYANGELDWITADGVCHTLLGNPGRKVRDVALAAPHGPAIVVLDGGELLVLEHLDRPEHRRELAGGDGACALAYHASSNTLAFARSERDLRCHEFLAARQHLGRLCWSQQLSRDIRSLAFSVDGYLLAALVETGEIHLIGAPTGDVLMTIRLASPADSLSFDAQGRLVSRWLGVRPAPAATLEGQFEPTRS